MPESELPIVISGAGIAGLAAALCLSKKGLDVEVIEKTEKLEAVGAGIQISPNAFHILQSIGLEGQLRSYSSFPDFIHVHDGRSGKVINSVPLGKIVASRFGAPYCVIHRGDLQQILFEACQNAPNIEFRFGCTVSNFETDSLSIRLSNGGITAAHALVVADGVWSKLRTDLLRLPPPKFSGKVAWRTLVPSHGLSQQAYLEDTHLWLAPNSHAVTYPVQNNKYLNIILILDGEEADRKQNVVTGPDHGFGSELSNLLRLGPEWSAWPLYETPNPISMATGRVALIGDAAHAMLPFAAQGAAMALEDAAVLADCLSQHPVESALRNFENSRLNRIKRVMKLARSNGQIYHLPQPFAFLRNLGMRLMPQAKLLERQAWVYGWRSDQL